MKTPEEWAVRLLDGTPENRDIIAMGCGCCMMADDYAYNLRLVAEAFRQAIEEAKNGAL